MLKRLGSFVVVALVLAGCWGLPSFPPPVTGLQTSATATTVSLSWTNPPSNFWGVRVYRAEGTTPPPGPGFSESPGNYLADLGDRTSFTDTRLSLGTTYSYTVIVYGADGFYSAPATITTTTTAATQVAAGGDHTCALPSNGPLECWGRNSYGQLGTGTSTDSWVPAPVSGVTGAVAVSAGGNHTCAVIAGGAVKCWGFGQHGQLGNGANVASGIPVPVTGITDAVSVSAGGNFSCALLSGGAVRCWGSGFYGQLGNGANAASWVPVPVTGITDAVGIAAGLVHACAALATGEVNCWGQNNYYGQLGNGSTTNSWVPVSVTGISDATAISAGGRNSCALLAGGSLKCWGYNGNGQLGNDTTTASSSTPVTVTGISDSIAITTGDNHSCTVLAGGGLRCWGRNYYGQLGVGTTTDSRVPIPVNGITDATATTAGGNHSCTLLAGGSVKCWGYNFFHGQLGNGTTNDSWVPVRVGGS